MYDTILVLTTGGTIDKVYFDARSDYQVGNTIIDTLMEQAKVNHPFEIHEILQKDSLDLTASDRELIWDEIVKHDTSKVVITHGTDTMTETAQYLMDIPEKTIVMTGSLAPARFAMTDAMFNVGMAIAAVQVLDYGVYITMNGTVFRADEVAKNPETNTFERRF